MVAVAAADSEGAGVGADEEAAEVRILGNVNLKLSEQSITGGVLLCTM